MGYTVGWIYVDGLNEAIAGLKAIGGDARKELEALNLKVGKLVKDQARQIVPVKTGHLRDSIRESKALNAVVVLAGRDPIIPYANVQNWGWFYDKQYFIRKNIKPKQFMNKAVAMQRKEIAEMYLAELVRIYEKYASQQYNGNVSVDTNTRGMRDW